MNIIKGLQELTINCEQCCGLCCVALYCSKVDGFPQNKEAGIPCINLQNNYRCSIHSFLIEKDLKGCTGYDCFGAGQKVMQKFYNGNSWNDINNKEEMFNTFMIVYHLHQMKWYLLESALFLKNKELEILEYLKIIDRLLNSNAVALKQYNLVRLHEQINEILRIAIQTRTRKHKKANYLGKDLRRFQLNGMDFSMSLMLESNLQDSDLKDACFLGCDMRNCNIKGADLSQSFYLTQAQINGCIGDKGTKLPIYIHRPTSW